MSKGIFGGLFDFNRDGKMSSFERASEFAFLHHLMESEENESASQRSTPSSYGFTSTRRNTTNNDDQALDLMIAGLDEVELSLMDEDTRRTTLEDAGLDPDDFAYLEDL